MLCNTCPGSAAERRATSARTRSITRGHPRRCILTVRTRRGLVCGLVQVHHCHAQNIPRGRQCLSDTGRQVSRTRMIVSAPNIARRSEVRPTRPGGKCSRRQSALNGRANRQRTGSDRVQCPAYFIAFVADSDSGIVHSCATALGTATSCRSCRERATGWSVPRNGGMSEGPKRCA